MSRSSALSPSGPRAGRRAGGTNPLGCLGMLLHLSRLDTRQDGASVCPRASEVTRDRLLDGFGMRSPPEMARKVRNLITLSFPTGRRHCDQPPPEYIGTVAPGSP